MDTPSGRILFCVAAFAMTGVCGLWSSMADAQAVKPAPFTKEQADTGRQDYMTSCASCHGDHLEGKGAPGLTGAPFAAGWAAHTTKELYEFTQSSMPICDGGTLPNDAYLDIVAFILQQNGAQPGTNALYADTDVKISDIVHVASPGATPSR
jgi:mono/diheme cytochrome c family protein